MGRILNPLSKIYYIPEVKEIAIDRKTFHKTDNIGKVNNTFTWIKQRKRYKYKINCIRKNKYKLKESITLWKWNAWIRRDRNWSSNTINNFTFNNKMIGITITRIIASYIKGTYVTVLTKSFSLCLSLSQYFINLFKLFTKTKKNEIFNSYKKI